MAYTLAQLAKIEVEPLRKYVMMNLLRDAKLMELLPFTNVDSLNVIATRWRTLPSAAFRQIGGSWTQSMGDTEQVWESLYILGKHSLPSLNLTVCRKLWCMFRYQALALIERGLARISRDANALSCCKSCTM